MICGRSVTVSPMKHRLEKVKRPEFSPFFLEMRSRRSLLISGIKRVLHSDGERVCLLTDAGERLEIEGFGMSCTVFCDRTVEIVGAVRSIGIGGEDESLD